MIQEEIFEFIANTKIINTHSHHLEDDFFVDFSLDKLLLNTYLSWSDVSFDSTKESRQEYLDKVRFKSYFIWLHKALKELYKIDEDLSVETWDMYSDAVSSCHVNKNWHKNILKDNCHYEKVILDAYWNPGSNNGDTMLFSPTFRINPLFFGYSRDAFDHDGFNIYNLYNKECADIDEFIFFTRKLIEDKIKSGCIAIKNAMAYDRTLDFEETSKDKAGEIFKHKDNIIKEDIKLFQDYIFYDICRFVSKLDIPVQYHAGMGLLEKTNALYMLNIIRENPDTKFVLFHAGFPWTDDVVGLLHAYPNVYIDICWLPILSPTNAEYVLNQLIEIGTSEKICWGCDTWTSEDSYGARLALIDVFTNVLAKKIERRYLSINDAKIIIENILYKNPKRLYKI